jgi:hypothetical protein
MEYERIEVCEWYDLKGRTRKRRVIHERFRISSSELTKVCNSLVRIADCTTKAIVTSSQGNRYLLK